MPTDQSTPPAPAKKPVSEAKRAANNRNAGSSTGPGGEAKKRTRFNAVKHGLSGQIAWLNKVTPEDRESLRRAYLRLNPRNAIERLHVDNLLTARLRERFALEVEHLVLTRQPVSLGGWDEHPFPFLRNPTALSTFQQLTRHVAHLSHTAEKELLALLRVRQDKWVAPKSNRAEDVVPNPNNSAAGAPAGTEPTNDEATIAGLPEPGSLDAALSDKRVLLPGEDEKAYEALARELWHDFGPTNLLEAFLVQDVIQTHWRLTRIGNLYHLVEEQGSRSTTGQECGLSFGFLQDSQGLGVSEILQQYEKVLQRRLEKRMALLRKVRTEGWTDNPVPFGDCGAAPCPADHPLAEKPSQVGNSNAAPTKTASGDQPQPLLDSAEPVATTSQPCGSTPATFDGRFRWLRRVADFWSRRWRS